MIQLRENRYPKTEARGFGLLVGLFVLVVVAVVGGVIGRTWLQHETRVARADIDKSTGVDELFKTEIGGIQQWFHARGLHRDDPVLLYLHGGPGTPMMPFESLFQNKGYEDNFIMVHWDQRAAGKSYTENPNLDYPNTVTYDRMVEDAVEVVEMLKKRYGKDQIIVVGHSWGTMLGLGLIQARPNDIAAYVGTGQAVDIAQNEALGYQATLAEARRLKNAEAIRALEALAPYPDSESADNPKIDILRQWQADLGVGISRRYRGGIIQMCLKKALLSPEYSLRDVNCFRLDTSGVWPRLSREVNDFKAIRLGSAYKVPMFLFLGRHDWQTPSVLAAQWLATIKAPTKQVVWFENSAHSPIVDEPEAFAKALVDNVRPLAVLP